MRTPSTDASALAGCATLQTLKPQASLHPAPGRNHSVLAMLGREKAKHPLQRSGWLFICWISAEHQFLMSRPSCPCGIRGCPGRAATGRSMRSECGSDQTQRAYSRADGAAPGDRIRGALRPRTAGRNSLKSGRRSERLRYRCTEW